MSTTEQTGAARIDHVVVPGTFDPVTLGHMDVPREKVTDVVGALSDCPWRKVTRLRQRWASPARSTASWM